MVECDDDVCGVWDVRIGAGYVQMTAKTKNAGAVLAEQKNQKTVSLPKTLIAYAKNTILILYNDRPDSSDPSL